MKKISRRNFLKTAAVCGAAGVMAACSAEETTTSTSTSTSTSADSADAEEVVHAEKLTTGWWGTDAVHEYTLAAGDYFTEQTGIALESTYLSYSDYFDKLTVLAASGELPDITRQGFSTISQYIGNDLFMPLDEYVENGMIDMTNVDLSLLDSGCVDGVLYGINIGSNALCALCNTDLIEGAGMAAPDETFTIEDYEAWQLEFASKTGKYATTLQFYANSTPMFEAELRTKGKKVFDGAALGFDADDFVAFLERAKRLQDGGAIPSIDMLSSELNSEDTQFTKNNCAMDITYTDTAPSVMGVLAAPCSVTLIPGVGPTKAAYLKASQYLCIPNTCKYKEDAISYINMWTNDSGFNAILAGRRGVPINSVIAEEVKANLDENNQKVFDYMTFVADYTQSAGEPDPMGASEVYTLYKSAVAEVLYGQKTAQEAVDSFMTTAAQTLTDAQ